MVHSHFSVFARFRIDAWMADVACPVACQTIWPACWLDTPLIGPLRRPLVLSKMSGTRDAASRSPVDDFWCIWSSCAEAGLFRAYSLAGAPLLLAALPFLVEVSYGFVAELLAAGVLVGCIGLARVMRLMCIVFSTSLALPLLL